MSTQKEKFILNTGFWILIYRLNKRLIFSKRRNEDILKDLLEGILEIPIEKEKE